MFLAQLCIFRGHGDPIGQAVYHSFIQKNKFIKEVDHHVCGASSSEAALSLL